MQCCGEERTTPFCPECGGVTNKVAVVLPELLSYCKKELCCHENIRDDEISYYKRHPDVWDSERLVVRKTKIASKWQRWVDALVEAIKLSEGSKP